MKNSNKKPVQLSGRRVLTAQKAQIVQSDNQNNQFLLTVWKNEIERLSSVVFDSYDDALDKLIENVLNRFPEGPDEGRSAKSFLREFLSSDPAIEAEMRSIMSIRT